MKRLIILLFVPCLMSCSNGVKLNNYNYTQDFHRYFENAFSERIENTNVEHIFVVPLSSCAPCVQATLKFYLSVEAKNTGIITCGQPDNPETLELVMRLKGHDNVWSDDSITISKYRTNIGSPYYLSI